ncbi:cytochrome P450 [Epithele typhae]|uniref:cytochrome P450 n=1 Tax=Epithele typhae TaxID=378194 RepID=UPI002007A8B9|nr:cytochrome P450 [Epithele typhae]KAH9923738.1 cytochrome P450 [Epithele typhae]
MPAISSAAYVGLAATLLYTSWGVARRLLSRSPLDNIRGLPRDSFFTGNMLQIFSMDNWSFMQELVVDYGPVSLVHDFFGTRALHTYDVKALHTIFIKEQEVFQRSTLSREIGNTLLGPGLLSTEGAMHRRQRKMLNPVFSAAYMRGITLFFHEIVNKLESAIETRVRDGPTDLDMVGWMGRAALELVGQGLLGHSFDPLITDSKDEFTAAVKSMVPSIPNVLYALAVLPLVQGVGPRWLRRLAVRLWPDPNVQRMRYYVDFIYARTQEMLAEKRTRIDKGEGEIMSQIAEGKDVMSILLRENMVASEEDRLPDVELLAQMSVFIVAGVDTTSNALSRVLDQLSQYPEVQERLREEVRHAKEQYGNDIPYDEVMALPYLDAVCRETLRLFPPVVMVIRESQEDVALALSDPVVGKDGSPMSEIIVPKNTTVIVNVSACNTNKALWGEDAFEWKPERWLQPLPKALEDARIPGLYSNQMTFIGGGHGCIGFKFSQLEMKIVLSTLIASFRFERSDKPFFWNSAGVTYPAAKVGNTEPEMVLKVSLA